MKKNDMDIKKRIREIVYSPDILREDFYSDKVRMVLFQKKNWKKELVKDKEVLETIRKHFPEADIKSTGINVNLIKLKNADFYIKTYGNRKTIDVKINIWSCSYYVSDIPNLIEYMKEIDRQMPEWEKEYANLISQNENEIKKVQRNSLFKGECNIDSILKCRIDLLLKDCRDNTQTGSMLKKNIEETNTSFKNIKMTIENDTVFIKALAANLYWSSYNCKEIKLEQLVQIDNMIPIWIEELKNWKLESEKHKKTTEIVKLSITTLITQKMTALGCEYKIKEFSNSISLYIKCKNNTSLKLSLPYDISVKAIKKRLGQIDEILEFIKFAPSHFQIMSGCD